MILRKSSDYPFVTTESLHARFDQIVEHKEDLHFGSEPAPLFLEDGTFNDRNWNSGQDIIRTRMIHDIGEAECYSLSDEDNTIIQIATSTIEDHTFVSIIVYHDYSEDFVNSDHYLIKWYKNRGCTETLMKNNHFMTQDEYIELCNMLIKIIRQD